MLLETEMTLRTPPPVARSLMERLGPADRRESLIGDLTEQYQRGRSSFWFWRQSLMAIAIGAVRDLRRDPDHVVHALLTGLGALLLYWQVSGPLTMALGYLARQNHWWRDTFWPVQEAIFFPFGFLGGIFAGWLVARFHRPQLAAALLALIAAWVALDLPSLFRLAPDAWGYPNYRYQLVMNLGRLLCMVLGTFVGGMSTGGPKRRTTLDVPLP
jgi:hypothetical protein